jgi:hypothetical protein
MRLMTKIGSKPRGTLYSDPVQAQFRCVPARDYPVEEFQRVLQTSPPVGCASTWMTDAVASPESLLSLASLGGLEPPTYGLGEQKTELPI